MTDAEAAYLRVTEIWNTRPTSPDHRRQLREELQAIQDEWGVGGVTEWERLMDDLM